MRIEYDREMNKYLRRLCECLISRLVGTALVLDRVTKILLRGVVYGLMAAGFPGWQGTTGLYEKSVI